MSPKFYSKVTGVLILTVLFIFNTQTVFAQSTPELQPNQNWKKERTFTIPDKLDRLPGKYIIKYKDGQSPDNEIKSRTSSF